MRALCLRRGGLGDTLLMIPVLRAMRARAPAASLTFAGVTEFADLLRRYRIVDAACSSEDLALWALRAGGQALARARQRLAAFDWIVGDDAALATMATSTLRVDVFDPRLGAAPHTPAAQQLLQRAHLTGSHEVALVDQRTALAPDARVMLHGGSGAASKCWPAAALRRLAGAIGAAVPLQVVLGPAELERGQAAGWPPGVEVVAPASIEELARRLATARAYVGHDSGPTHLAAALRVPTIALFVSTDPRVWGPVGAHVQISVDRPSAQVIDRIAHLAVRA